ncbi:MAG: DUF5686 family protein [Owenweeksia sp.]|nr:DUF5686 family protein [Owenweeksia sp.]
MGYSKLNDRLWMELPGLIPRFRFNTVEGFNLDAAATFNTSLDTMARLKLEPTLRYGFSSTRLYGKLNTEIESGRPTARYLGFRGRTFYPPISGGGHSPFHQLGVLAFFGAQLYEALPAGLPAGLF